MLEKFFKDFQTECFCRKSKRYPTPSNPIGFEERFNVFNTLKQNRFNVLTIH